MFWSFQPVKPCYPKLMQSMDKVFFDNWESIWRTLIISVLAYVSLVLILRISGKRTLSKMNAYDLIVTVALGSTLSTVLLNKDVALADGVLTFVLLIFLQYMLTYVSVRSRKINNLVKSTPSLLVYKGRMLKDAMMRERIAEDEVYASLRENGYADLQQIDAVVLETDGGLTVIAQVDDMGNPVMSDVKKPAT